MSIWTSCCCSASMQGAIALTKIDAVSAERVDEVLLQLADRVSAIRLRRTGRFSRFRR